MTHSLCPLTEATVILVEERKKCQPVKVMKIALPKEDIRNYIVGKLSQYADHNDVISVSKFTFFTFFTIHDISKN